ncbi:hypothetical protein PINS_up018787 [Pythium insidiosum]|nr:hypothetical protein PINS_up018787 [Pythium insidiosum]
MCTVKKLVMNDADVDDHECTLFMIAFEQNKSVEQLLLRSNRIGDNRRSLALGAASTAAATLPQDSDAAGALLPTGGEAIGSMLNVNLTIQELDLSWNMIRFKSASPIANALQLNYNLRELNLSYNGCGDQGAIVLGHALRTNSSLVKLNLAYNSINARGGLALASGLIVNKGLRELILDGNAIGIASGRELMHAACSRVHTTAVCNLSMYECSLIATHHSNQSSGDNQGTSSANVYNPSEPEGKYYLDLSDPYEHMIAHELLRLATFKRGYRFAKLEHFSSKTAKTGNRIELQRRPEVDTAPQRAGEDPGPQAEKSSPLLLLFSRIDRDNSGAVDVEEIKEALRSYGIEIADDLLSTIVDKYDYDKSGGTCI